MLLHNIFKSISNNTMSASASVDCSICLVAVNPQCNSTVTNCGHCFHASCLMKHTALNGFHCPYCRTNMVVIEEPEEEEEEEEESSEEKEEEQVFPELERIRLHGKYYMLDVSTNYLYDWIVYQEEGEYDRVGKWDPVRNVFVNSD